MGHYRKEIKSITNQSSGFCLRFATAKPLIFMLASGEMNEMRCFIFIVNALAVAAYAVATYAALGLLCWSWPLAPVTLAFFLLLGAVALVLVYRLPASLCPKDKKTKVLIVGILTPLALVIVLPCFHIASARAPVLDNLQGAREFWIISQIGKPGLKEPLDTYGGRYHMETRGTTTRIWSDGPDRLDGAGKKSIALRTESFERAFKTAYCYSFLDRALLSVRAMALWELVHVWHTFDGDLVYEYTEDGGFRPLK